MIPSSIRTAMTAQAIRSIGRPPIFLEAVVCLGCRRPLRRGGGSDLYITPDRRVAVAVTLCRTCSRRVERDRRQSLEIFERVETAVDLHLAALESTP